MMSRPFRSVLLVYQAFIGDRERWPLWLPVLLGSGIEIYFSLPSEPPLWAGWATAAILATIAWRLLGKSDVFLLFLACAVVSLGVGVSSLRTWWVAAPVIATETGPLSLTGQVRHVEHLVSGQRVTLIHLSGSRLAPASTPQAVRVKLMGEQPPFGPGDWLELRANLLPPPPPAMPGAFDFQRQSYFQGLGGVGFAFGKVAVIGAAPHMGIDSLGFAFQRVRVDLARRIGAGFADEPAGRAVGGVATALMTGERGAIPETVLDDMRASGLAHLLAISGLHVGLIAGIVFFALRGALALIAPLALRYPIKKWAAVGALFAAFGYALLAGATVPTQRAFLMIALVLLAVLFDRRAVSMRLVAWAAMAILLLSPESLLGASFQMSFSAVVALVAVYEYLRRKGVFDTPPQTWSGKVGRYVAGVALTTAVAGVATGVFAAYHFNRVADFSLAANLIAVPVTALWIMPWAVVAYALMPFGLEYLALAPMGWGIEAVIATAREVAHWPGAVTDIAAFSVWGLVWVAVGGLWLALWQRPWRLWGAPVAVLGLLGVLGGPSAPDVLIHPDGKLAAVRTGAGDYSVSTLTAAKFERDVWLRRAGLSAKPRRWRDPDTDPQQLRCDALGCLYRTAGRSVAFTRAPEALNEDCWRADVLVAAMALNPAAQDRCRVATRLITAEDLQRGGTHAIWLGDGKGGDSGPVHIETVNGQRGDRPWVIKAKK
ncbi:ComEC/Rec2 family competence protein [Magnetovibrio sp.]|uniref:ComEC/Rec2 family competence protein n=1 Tax=Magnetovibrio sp. TaxID=2024836 RepID=UPI002F92700D